MNSGDVWLLASAATLVLLLTLWRSQELRQALRR